MSLIIVVGTFSAGRIVIAPGALSELSEDEAMTGLARHLAGDWGDLDESDWKKNDAALQLGRRLFSRYVTPGGTRFWIITEHDRSVTTILLPRDD